MQPPVAEPVLAQDERLSAELAQQLAGDDAVLMVPQDFLDAVGGVGQTGGPLWIDRGGSFGCIPQPYGRYRNGANPLRWPH